ncbi:uncharacterized protein AMSG_08482 [Thecamonas trahens ATCC 50062]|uniref:Transmembrane protein n=1 Tax=Thecamonas trahens ATCC 50062 TaxID=461836 RepID=A0A0L0DK13_THETB|nr:hypothetical protein AMSG_08482 [Thecamonas trahens ATCC 50062]KNC52617.1 hypothetical protein AMSG_08482 [Thecamonas trahens ATCC 50062]|eukprot:XP_013755174.1 hypothetical protein AMSG_08482 [Thecamonas trahens ATCC 50062]
MMTAGVVSEFRLKARDGGGFWHGLGVVCLFGIKVVLSLAFAPISFMLIPFWLKGQLQWIGTVRQWLRRRISGDEEAAEAMSESSAPASKAELAAKAEQNGKWEADQKRLFRFSLAALVFPIIAYVNVIVSVYYDESVSRTEVYVPIMHVVVIVFTHFLSLEKRLSDGGAFGEKGSTKDTKRFTFYLPAIEYDSRMDDDEEGQSLLGLTRKEFDEKALLATIERHASLDSSPVVKPVAVLTATIIAAVAAIIGPLHRMGPLTKTEATGFFGQGTWYDVLIVVNSAYCMFVFSLTFLLEAMAIAAHYWKIFFGLRLAFKLVQSKQSGIVNADGTPFELELNSAHAIQTWLALKRSIRRWGENSLVVALVNPSLVMTVVYLAFFAIIIFIRFAVLHKPIDEFAWYSLSAAVPTFIFLVATIYASVAIAELPEKENEFLTEKRIVDLEKYLDTVRKQQAAAKSRTRSSDSSEDSFSELKLDLAVKHLELLIRMFRQAIDDNVPRPIRIFGLPSTASCLPRSRPHRLSPSSSASSGPQQFK